MTLFEILVIAVGLSMDAFAVSLGLATSGQTAGRRATFRLSFHFGLFQFLMPVLGWSAGVRIEPLIGAFDHWIAFILLAAVGGRMIHAGLATQEESYRSDPTRGLSLVLLSVATSIDALAIGLSLAMLRVTIWYPSFLIGVVTGSLCVVGIRLGVRLGSHFGKRMEVIGGLILVAIGLRLVVGHLSG
jgi:putative Mn2+ efflux pump MntP